MPVRVRGWFFLFLAVFVIASGCATSGGSQKSVYKVRVDEGDTLASIAARYATTWQAIARENGISDTREVYVGQVLIVRPGPGGHIAKSGLQERSRYSKNTDTNKEAGLLFKPAASDQEIIPTIPSDETKPTKANKEEKSQPERKRGGLLYGNGEQSSQLIWPVHGRVSSHFGWRGRHFHNGIDIVANRGTPVQAAAEGRVSFVGRKPRYGQTVVVEHNGFFTLYAHLSKMVVKVGQIITQGSKVGTVGATGNARGYHLHFEFWSEGQVAINPMGFLRDLSS